MGVLVKCLFDGTKTKYIQDTEFDKEQVALLKKFMATKDQNTIFFKQFLDKDEVSFNGKLPKFFRTIMLPPLLEKCKNDYGISTPSELEAILSLFYLKAKRKKADGTEYEIAMRVDEVNLDAQVAFISKVANFALSKYQVKYPNANEIDAAI